MAGAKLLGEDVVPQVWYRSATRLADALREDGTSGVERVYVFHIPPRFLGGIYSAAFVGEGGVVHKLVQAYLDEERFRGELQPLENAIRWLSLPKVSGRVEVGAVTGGRLHYFLPDVDVATAPGAAESRRAEAFAAWAAAVRPGASGGSPLREVVGHEGDRILCASRGRDHYLVRLECCGQTDAASVAASLGLTPSGRLAAHGLLRDIMGEWTR